VYNVIYEYIVKQHLKSMLRIVVTAGFEDLSLYHMGIGNLNPHTMGLLAGRQLQG
jgi:hypothetical protein